MAFLLLAAAKKQLNIPTSNTADDVELQDFIDAVEEIVESYIGPVNTVNVSEQHPSDEYHLVLHKRPVLSLTSVVATRTGGTDYTVADLHVDPVTGIVSRKDGLSFTGGPFTVAYSAGRATAPPSGVRGGLIILQHIWETQRGGAGLPRQGGMDTVHEGSGYAIPNRAVAMLRPKRQTARSG